MAEVMEVMGSLEFAGKEQAQVSDKSTSDGSSGSEVEGDVQVKGAAKTSQEELDSLREYEAKFGEARDGSRPGFTRTAFPWYSPKPRCEKPQSEVLEALAAKDKKQGRKPRLWDVDSEGEEVTLCAQCFLPMGETAYKTKEGKGPCVHGECMAQILLKEAQEEEDKRVVEQNQKKLDSRLEHEIGWRMDSVPKNAPIAERLGCSPVPQGLCCLVFDEASKTVRIAATHEPAASVNLEYLLLALKVRRTACREPLFSLDPVDPNNLTETPQKKRYEPDWLAGTSVGDVMFQADYLLKELAMGEYAMPVVGMLSVFDWSEMVKNCEQWAGREWFVVRKAEVRMAEDKTLIPHVRMGVEAREQVIQKDGMVDAPVTGANHPLKKFAEAFTRNFDLIAERKSVIFHLRELAKASVMAKYLIDSNTRVDASWYDLADEIVNSTAPEAHPEIPQLWNMRGNSRIQVKDGKLVDLETGFRSHLRAIYGGVEFGLDRFELAQRHALAPGASGLPGLPGVGASMAQMQQAGLQNMQLGPSGRPMFMPQRFQLTQRGEMPQGVDLNLDKFALSGPERFAGTLPPCSASLDSAEARVTLGRSFLQSMRDGSFAQLKSNDAKLLDGIFNPAMADRTQEGDTFVPPDPNMEYIERVRNLVGEELSMRERRKARFCDAGFVVGSAGPEFPRSWTSSFQLEQDMQSQAMMAAFRSGLAKVQMDAAFQKTFIKDILPTAAPEFNKATEDGVVFRIYQIGSLEVRTVQEPNRPEEVGAVFSRRAPTWQLKSASTGKDALESEKVLNIKFYAEPVACEQDQAPWSYKQLDFCHYYVVLETDGSHVIVTEKLEDGSTSWVVNPTNLEDRNSLAKLLYTGDCKEDAIVRDLKILQITWNKPMPQVHPSDRKNYARAVMATVCKGVRRKGKGRRAVAVSVSAGTAEPGVTTAAPRARRIVRKTDTQLTSA